MFVDNPYPAAVNGSLWSLPVEVLMYMLLPLLLSGGRRAILVALGTATVGLHLLPSTLFE